MSDLQENISENFVDIDVMRIKKLLDLIDLEYDTNPDNFKFLENNIEFRKFVINYLNVEKKPSDPRSKKRIHYMDFFCGGGGLSLGVHTAAKLLGYDAKLLLAADKDSTALKLVEHHFSPLVKRACSLEELIKFDIDPSGETPSFNFFPEILDQQISQFKGKVDLIVGGPPCQGHSNLNNLTRGNDPRNYLYFLMPAFAIALEAKTIIIENVRSIVHASEDVVGVTQRLLESYGYFVKETVLDASQHGVAQTRTRHFLIASKVSEPLIDEISKLMRFDELSFDDVNLKLPKSQHYPTIMESESALSKENIERINHLFNSGDFDLHNEMRPDCHKDGHTYPSVYGRLRGDAPSGTVTTGYTSPGRGRYIHPHLPRMINSREAARLQSFPDWYFANVDTLNFNRSNLSKIIGDAVPSLMLMPIIFSLARSFKSANST